MTTTEHLQQIKAKCEHILELAELRSDGLWEVFGGVQFGPGYHIKGASGLIVADNAHKRNATFIAACAGPMEAAARSTIAAIDLALNEFEALKYSDPDDYYARMIWAENVANAIIAAWPEELL